MPEALGSSSVKVRLALAVALVAALSTPTSAAGSLTVDMPVGGSFTRAEANADWTTGSVAGSVRWGPCSAPWPPVELENGFHPNTRSCQWVPYLTVGPGSDAAECLSPDRRWPQLGEEVTLAWSGGWHSAGGSQAFDLTDVPLSGVPGQLACLSVLEHVEERPYCPPGAVCTTHIIVNQVNKVAASALLSGPEPPAPTPTAPTNTELPQLSGTPKSGQTLTCSAGAWEGSPTELAYAWLRDGTEIAGESSATYVVDDTDRGHSIACEVTAANEGGSATATSSALAIPAPAPPPPSIEDQFVTDISQDNATLNAVINPNGLLTKYKLQIDTTGNFNFDRVGCVLHPPAVFCGQVFTPGEPQPPGLVQPPESGLPANFQAHHVSIDLASIGATLQPATTYHFRAIAGSGLPFVVGPDLTFTTLPPGEVVVDKFPPDGADPPRGDVPAPDPDPAARPAAEPPAAAPSADQAPRAKGAGRCKRKPSHRKACTRIAVARALGR